MAIKPRVTIVIPCFNAGSFLREAIASVLEHPDRGLYELIIVNDGSTDEQTNAVLCELESEGLFVIHQENMGPAAARNRAISESEADYILFLDSDNKIRREYIDRGVVLLDKNPSLDVVYGKPTFFGIDNGFCFKPKPFDLRTILLGNYIDMCAVIRRKLWIDLGGLDEERILIGHEDWEFWIRAGLAHAQFCYVDEILFDYRRTSHSLIKTAVEPVRYEKMLDYVYTKHRHGLIDSYRQLLRQSAAHDNDINRPFRSFLKYLYYKFVSGRPRF